MIMFDFTESSSVEKAATNARTDATVIQSPCPPRIPYRFTTPQGLEIDMRLCSQDKMSSVKPYLLQILNAAMQVGVYNGLKDNMIISKIFRIIES